MQEKYYSCLESILDHLKLIIPLLWNRMVSKMDFPIINLFLSHFFYFQKFPLYSHAKNITFLSIVKIFTIFNRQLVSFGPIREI